MFRFSVVAFLPVLLLGACSDTPTEPDPPRIELSDTVATLYKGSTLQLTATVRGQGAATPVVWASADTLVASVDSTGLVRGRAPGSTTVTATAGTLSRSARITVGVDQTPPTFTSLSVSPGSVELAGGGATLSFTVRAADAQSGVGSVRVLLSHPGSGGGTHPLFRCTATAPASGTVLEGTWQCSIPLNAYVESGTWRAVVLLTDRAGNNAPASPPVDVPVAGSLPDAVRPTLVRLSLSPDSVDVKAQDARVSVQVEAADAHSGISATRIHWMLGTNRGTISLALPSSGSVNEGTWGWSPLIARGSTARALSITSIEIVDFRGNVLALTAAELQAAGYRTEVRITS